VAARVVSVLGYERTRATHQAFSLSHINGCTKSLPAEQAFLLHSVVLDLVKCSRTCDTFSISFDDGYGTGQLLGFQ
jgi:hypothetical protein